MRFLKVFLLLLLAIVAAYLVFCIMGPKDLNLSKSVTIGASPSAVFEEIRDFARWKSWSPWALRDSAMSNEYEGEPGTVGHLQRWESRTEGSGTQTILEVRVNEFIRTELQFKDWSESSFSNWLIEPAGDSTRVTWTMEGGELPFMIRGLAAIMGMRSGIEKDYADGLNNLKSVVESRPAINMEIVDISDTWYIGKRMQVNMKEIDSSMYANTYGELMDAIGGPRNMAGMPMTISHEVNMETGEMDMEIAIPIAAQMAAPAGFSVGMIPGGRCAKYVFTGPYDQTGGAWSSFMEAVLRSYKPRWSGFEIYANDPAEVGNDPSRYITWLMQPVE